MPVKVSDASVLAAIAFGEPRAGEATALLDQASLHEPTLLVYELTSVAHKKVLRCPDRVDAISRALDLVLGLEIQWMEVNHRAVFALALEKGLTGGMARGLIWPCHS
ncbi:MAG: type II toxin-antitoxin system VapC family toxin [Candidatus Rokubacteria bacterium]|nr:type II toxin-antitoxin system VapC family toxin [Candidatus Rokubacteria bacterium]